MLNSARLQDFITIVMLTGIVISVILVTLGGFIYLLHDGNQPLPADFFQTSTYHTNILQIFRHLLAFSPIGIIELGLIFLVFTQIVRVALITFFYILTKDYWFILISSFVLTILIYSIFWRS